jgi:hypothetical protein
MFFSLYQHSSNNILEIYNPSCTYVGLSEFSVRIAPYSNHASGAAWSNPAISLGASTLLPLRSFVVCQTMFVGCDLETALAFDGDDAVGLFHNHVLIDIIGSTKDMAAVPCDNCPGFVTNIAAPWTVGGVGNATRLHKLVRRTRVSEGSVDFFYPRGLYVGSEAGSEWDVSTPTDPPSELGKFVCDTCTCPVGLKMLIPVTCGTTGASRSLQGLASPQIDCPLNCLARMMPLVVSPALPVPVPPVLYGDANLYTQGSPICLAAMHSGVLPFSMHAFPLPSFVPQPAPSLLDPACTWSGTSSFPSNSGGDPTLFPASHRPNGRPFFTLTQDDSAGATFVASTKQCLNSQSTGSGLSISFAPLSRTVCDATDCGSALGRGHCNQQTGKCVCNAPWRIDDINGTCSRADCASSCNNGGCDPTTGQCVCNPGWTGSECTVRTCAGRCNGRGVCNPLTGECACPPPWFGAECELKLCLNNCTNPMQGVCDYSTGQCTCGERFFGEDCSLRRCVNHCSAFGTCDFSTGQCRCKGSLPAGSPVPTACLFDDCPSNTPGVSCSGNGSCNFTSRMCKCNTGWRGLDCSIATGT